MVIKALKASFEIALKNSIEELGTDSKLREACSYALLNGGKRLRPLIVLLVADAIGNSFDVMPAALSLEYFHTASLIADDLPCMDNDDLRREVPSLHKAFDETTALLASYALISAAFEKIHEGSSKMLENPRCTQEMALKACFKGLELASVSSGIKGAAGGQFIDLFPKELSLEFFDELIYKKTVTLFEVAFYFGWIFGGGDLSKLEEVKKVGFHFGRAFQIADDLSDCDQDEKRGVNLVLFAGKAKSKIIFKHECEELIKSLRAVKLDSPQMNCIIEKLIQYGTVN